MEANRWTSYQFKNGKRARNRVVVPPMASQTADSSGFVTPTTVKHYGELSKSGAGLIFVEYSSIHSSGKGEPNQLAVDGDEKVEGLIQISQVIHQNEALAGLQIVHVGGKSSRDLTGGSLLGPSAIPVPIKGGELDTPIAMDEFQVEEMISWYVQAAERAKKAGFDIVELHAAHGYGLNQWLSPVTNQRNDIYGGSISGRSLLLRKIVMEIKKRFSDLLLAVRLPAQDHFLGGLTYQEMIWVAGELENLGIDLIDVSSGIGGWRRPHGRDGQGYLVGDAAILKAHVNLPIIGVGGIKSGAFIDSIISDQKTDFAAIGRAILKNPSLWYQRNLVRGCERLKEENKRNCRFHGRIAAFL